MVKKKRSRQMPLFDKISLTLNIIAVSFLLASYLSPFIDPRDFSIIAMLGFGYQVLVIINLVFIIYWVIRLKPFVLISVIGIILGFHVIISSFGFRFFSYNKFVRSHNGIRIMAYNVRGFNGIDIHDNDEIQTDIAKIVKDNTPDIVSFEEFLEPKIDSGANMKLIEKVLEPCSHYYKAFRLDLESSTGNAIFSKYPILNMGAVESPAFLDIKAIFTDIKYKGRILRIYSIHLTAVSVGGEKEKFLKGNFNFGSSSFIESKLTEAFVKRSYQITRIKEHMAKCPYPYIVAGDFNDTPNSFAVNELGDGLENAFIEKGAGLGTTYYSTFPKLHIDYIFASPQFDILDYTEIDKKLSDHKPIITDVELK